MKVYTVFNKKGKVLRSGICQDSTLQKQVEDGEFVMEGLAQDTKQKVEFDLDDNGKPINPRIKDHRKEGSPEIPFSK